MLSRIGSYLLQGIDALPCEVEVDLNDRGASERPLIVGLPDTAVKESLERVRSAMENSGYAWPVGRLLINLAPADVRKEGPSYDLPIAVGLLLAMGAITPSPMRATPDRRSPSRVSAPSTAAERTVDGRARDAGSAGGGGDPEPDGWGDDLDTLDRALDLAGLAGSVGLDPRRYLLAGELALDGRLRPVRGVIAMAALAREMGRAGVIVPRENAPEASVVPGIEALGAETLAEVVGLLTGQIEAHPHPPADVASMLRTAEAEIDFADVRGQEGVKRAIIIAAAGSHNLLMLGPAGTGKSMMAKALPGVLPPMSPEEALEVTRVYSAAGKLAPGSGLICVRPVRSPHHTASGAAVIGGGIVPRPGEVSLAHRGVLFLDELPEFPRDVLETLRQPLEDHVVTIARSHSAVRFPASFMLVAAMNPTPRGDMPAGEVGRRAMDRYLSKLSGPLVDRIDIHVEAPAVPFSQLSGQPRGTSSAEMRRQVLAARQRQEARQGPTTPNARLTGRRLDTLAPMTEEARTLLGTAMAELGLSARAYDKIRRVARTIADLDGSDVLRVEHVAEAVQYRLLDRRV
jgi:magnesium chelatase family protein